MEETNVTMTTEKTQGETAAKENETKAEKFIRIGEYRMNKAVDAIGRLENLANRGSYEYTQEQVDAMFQALEGRVAEIKARFTPKKTAESTAEEVEKMGVEKAAPLTVDFKVGDTVQITAGPLEGFMGLVEGIDTESFKVKLKVNMFGRETPAEVDIAQVELP